MEKEVSPSIQPSQNRLSTTRLGGFAPSFAIPLCGAPNAVRETGTTIVVLGAFLTFLRHGVGPYECFTASKYNRAPGVSRRRYGHPAPGLNHGLHPKKPQMAPGNTDNTDTHRFFTPRFSLSVPPYGGHG
jgi:hypothetical protein